jgi:pre-rRNA-processing protein TSR1
MTVQIWECGKSSERDGFLLFARALTVSRAERFKTSLQFLILPYGQLYATLDACKAADYVVFALSSITEVSPWGDTLLRTVQAQGLPTAVSVVHPTMPVDSKARSGILKSLLSFMQYFIPSQARVYDLSVNSDRLTAARALCEGKPQDVRWREGRPWLLGEEVQWEEGALAVTGVVRGAPLSANRLVHLPELGDFQISKVWVRPSSIQTWLMNVIIDHVCSFESSHESGSGYGCGAYAFM